MSRPWRAASDLSIPALLWLLVCVEPLVPRGEQPTLSNPRDKASRARSPVLGQLVLPPPLESIQAPWPFPPSHGHNPGLSSDALQGSLKEKQPGSRDDRCMRASMRGFGSLSRRGRHSQSTTFWSRPRNLNELPPQPPTFLPSLRGLVLAARSFKGTLETALRAAEDVWTAAWGLSREGPFSRSGACLATQSPPAGVSAAGPSPALHSVPGRRHD